MHKIQSQILNKLSTDTVLTYSRLKNKNIEGNVFTYHLNRLIEDGLVIKEKKGLYSLTAKGKFHLGRISKEDLHPRIQPKIVTLVALTNDQGETLLYLRKKEPFRNMIGYPYGKVHLGETIAEAASRELLEKTNLRAKLSHRGDVYLTVFQEDELLNQMLCHIFSAENPSGVLKKDTSIGKCFFRKILDGGEKDFMPGFRDISTLLQYGPKDHFFAEFTYNI